jgi:hypothetical protein
MEQIKIGWRPYTAPSISILLDFYGATGTVSAFSLRKLRTNYTGPALRIRRTYDNQETDINFVGYDQIDTTTMNSFVNVGASAGEQDIQNWDYLNYTNIPEVTSGMIFNIDSSLTSSYPGSGSTINSLIGSYTGTLNNVDYEGSNGGTLGFNGTNSNIEFNSPVITNTSNYTLSSWVYLNKVTTDSKILSFGSSVNSLSIGITGANEDWFFNHSTLYTEKKRKYTSNLVVGNLQIPFDEDYTGKWINLTMTVAGGTSIVYVNGSEYYTIGGTAFNLSSNLKIGSEVDGTKSFNGRISKVKIYNRTLSNLEVAKNYQNGCGLFTQDQDALRFITAAGLTGATHINAVHRLVRDFKNSNLWDKMKFIYPFVGGTETSHKLNLKDPRDLDAAYRITFNGGWSHSATGALPNGTNAWANTFYNPSTNPFVNRNWMHMGMYTTTQTASSTGVDMGYRSSGVSWYIKAKTNATNSMVTANHINTTETAVNGVAGGGSYLIHTSMAFNLYGSYYYTGAYQNGNYLGGVNTGAAAAELNYNIYLGALNNQGTASNFSNKELSFATIGDKLLDGDLVKYNAIIHRFQTALGRQSGTAYPTINHPDPEVEVFIGNAGLTGATHTNAISKLVSSMKLEGIWNKALAVYPHIGGNSSSHSLNLKGYKYNLSFVGGWIHSDTGSKPNGTTAYAITGILPGIEFAGTTAINRGHFGFYTRTNSDSTGYDLMANDSTVRYTGIRYYHKKIYGYIGQDSSVIDPKESSGFNFIMRGPSAGNSSRIWNVKNDSIDYADGIINTASLSRDGQRSHIYIALAATDSGVGYGFQNYSDREHSFTTIGNYEMSELQALKYARIIQRYQEDLGRSATITDNPYSYKDATVVTWYDQSTSANHLKMFSRVSQPKIYTNGSIIKDVNGKPAIQFDGWNDGLVTKKTINFQNVRAIISVNSGTAEGIRTGSNNSTIQSTTITPYQYQALGWYTSGSRPATSLENQYMIFRPFGDNTYSEVYSNNLYMYGAENSTFSGEWGGYTRSGFNLLKDPGVNISSAYIQLNTQMSSNNFIIDNASANYSQVSTPSSAAIFMGGFLASGANYMSKMKVQEFIMLDSTSNYIDNKVPIEYNIYRYWQPFTASQVSDDDARQFCTMLRLTMPQQNAVNTLVTSLKSAGLWDKIYALYPFVGGSGYKHSIDLKNPSYSYESSSWRIQFGGGIVHDSTGSAFNGTTGYGLITRALSDFFTTNNFHSAVYVNGGTLANNYIWNAGGSNTNNGLFVTGGNVTHSKATDITVATGSTGCFIGTSLTSNKLLKNGSIIGTSAIPANSVMSNGWKGQNFYSSGGVPRLSIASGLAGIGNGTNVKIAFLSFGSGLTDQESVDYNNIIQTFQNALSR